MLFLRKFFQQLLFGNILIASSSFFWVLENQKIISPKENLQFAPAFLLFFATLFSYSFQRFKGIKLTNEEASIRQQWFNQNKSTQQVTLLISALGGAICFYFYSNFLPLLYLMPVALLTLFYSWPLTPTFSLRTIPTLKIFIIALVWSLGPLFILKEVQNLSYNSILFLIIRNFLFTFAITIPFDIRDLNADAKQLKTLPQLIGIVPSKVLSIVTLLCWLWLDLSIPGLNWKISTLPVFAFTSVLIALSKPEKKEFLYLGGLDSTMIFRSILYLGQLG